MLDNKIPGVGNLRVLLVEDDMFAQRLAASVLRQLGINNLTIVKDGKAAIDLLGETELQFDLIISDWNMQPVTGLELLREVRADAALKGLPFIVITAESKTENVIAAREAGVSNYIVKPFNAEMLRAKIAGIAGNC